MLLVMSTIMFVLYTDNIYSQRRCTGLAACAACSTCSGCKHCNSGGSCGICGGGESRSDRSSRRKVSSRIYGLAQTEKKLKAKTYELQKVRSNALDEGEYYNGHKIYIGPRGGRYYINKNGNKTYI